jgi:hypothetical protein
MRGMDAGLMAMRHTYCAKIEKSSVDKKFVVYYNFSDNFPVWADWPRKGA